jgi:hypothetical protein
MNYVSMTFTSESNQGNNYRCHDNATLVKYLRATIFNNISLVYYSFSIQVQLEIVSYSVFVYT